MWFALSCLKYGLYRRGGGISTTFSHMTTDVILLLVYSCVRSQVAAASGHHGPTRDGAEGPGAGAASLSARLLRPSPTPRGGGGGRGGGGLKEEEEDDEEDEAYHRSYHLATAAAAAVTAASDGSASLGDPENDSLHSHHSHSPASSACSATYSNLGEDK